MPNATVLCVCVCVDLLNVFKVKNPCAIWFDSMKKCEIMPKYRQNEITIEQKTIVNGKYCRMNICYYPSFFVIRYSMTCCVVATLLLMLLLFQETSIDTQHSEMLVLREALEKRATVRVSNNMMSMLSIYSFLQPISRFAYQNTFNISQSTDTIILNLSHFSFALYVCVCVFQQFRLQHCYIWWWHYFV